MTTRKRILFICGSINQTTQLHQIACCLSKHDCLFTPYYGDRIESICEQIGLAEGTIVGFKLRARCLEYLHDHQLPIDLNGGGRPYDLVVSCSDLIVQQNIRGYPLVLVQEGMTDPEGFAYYLLRRMSFLPRWMASTSMTGTSNLYTRFCVASYGYRDLFIRKGADPNRLVVTGIPNFDNCEALYDNSFPYRHYVLACTTDMRETYRFEWRPRFIKWVLRIADGRPLFFKLHPNEKHERAIREIHKFAPHAKVFTDGEVGPMVANCDVLITQFSSVTYLGLILDKEVHTYLDIDELSRLLPIQNGGRSSLNIAEVCRQVLNQQKQRNVVHKSRMSVAMGASL